jgi:lysophospholipase
MTPFILAQAASRQSSHLANLIASLETPSTDPSSSTPASATSLALPAILNEPATATLQTPLHLAVLAALPSNVDLLLRFGASVHARDSFGHSPLFYAAKHGDDTGLEMVKILKAAGSHLSEQEILSGQAGFELARASKAVDPAARSSWEEALGEEGVEQAKAALASLV